MRKIIIPIIIIMGATISGQTWKGGNTADYDANSVCSDVYLLHRPGTTFPTDTRQECCVDTVLSTGWGLIEYTYGDTVIVGSDTIIVDSTTVYIPVVLENEVDTVYIGSDTLVISSIDSIYVFGGNDRTFFTTFREAYCESVLTGIDTIAGDTSYCVFCDSILRVAWWEVSDSDTLQFDAWNMLYPNNRDTCYLINSVTINVTGDYVDNTVNVTNIFETYEYYDNHTWITDGDSTYQLGDTVNAQDLWNWIYQDYTAPVGIWVKECGCTSSVDTTFTSDSLDAFLCISSAWTAYQHSGSVYRTATSYPESRNGAAIGSLRHQYAWHTVARSFSSGTSPTAVSAKIAWHDGYMSNWVDTISAVFNAGDEVATGIADSTINILAAMYYQYDTTGDYGCFIADTHNVYPFGYPNQNAGDIPTVSLGLDRRSYKFTYTYDFSDDYTSDEIAAINATQPGWLILAPADDIVPYVRINGVSYGVDTAGTDDYSIRLVEISPTVNYSEPIEIETGVYSKNQQFLGGQVVFALDYGDTLIENTCWTFRDSIELPSCDDIYACSDSICFFFPQGWGVTGWTGFRRENDTTICFSTCDLDTLDLSSQSYGGTSWLPFFTVSSDSVDSFKIATYNDSTVFSDGDGDGDNLVIHMDTDFGANEIRFADGSQTDTTRLFQTADTFHIATDDTTIIIKVGSESLYLSDKAIWFGTSFVDSFGTALGVVCSTYGDYSAISGGVLNTSRGNGATIAGGYANTTSHDNTAIGGGQSNVASAQNATIGGGAENISSGSAATVAGGSNNIAGAFAATVGGGKDNYALGIYSGIPAGRNLQIDSTGAYSFLIGLNDTLSADSTFRSAYPYNEFKGGVKIGDDSDFLNGFYVAGDSLFFIVGAETLKVIRD